MRGRLKNYSIHNHKSCCLMREWLPNGIYLHCLEWIEIKLDEDAFSSEDSPSLSEMRHLLDIVLSSLKPYRYQQERIQKLKKYSIKNRNHEEYNIKVGHKVTTVRRDRNLFWHQISSFLRKRGSSLTRVLQFSHAINFIHDHKLLSAWSGYRRTRLCTRKFL